MIEVINLKKSYSTVQAVKGINFSVEEGKFVAFLGENGAGKSTTINIMATLLKKTSGDVIINGNKIDANDASIRNDIGVIFQGKMLDDFLTVKENIFSRGRLYGLSKQTIAGRLEHLTKKINLTEFLDRPYGKLSGGQKRRADIVRALINEPKILILDEPTTGLDPYTRKQVWQSIKELQEETNLTVFLTTHYMEEAATADYLIVIDQGEIKAKDTPENLRINYSYDKLFVLPKHQQSMMNKLNEMNLNFTIDRDRLIVSLKNCFDALNIVNELKNDITAFDENRKILTDILQENKISVHRHSKIAIIENGFTSNNESDLHH